MALSDGASCLKYLIFVFNLLFSFFGLVVVVLGALQYNSEVVKSIYNGGIAFIFIGVIMFLIATVGWCGAIQESGCLLIASNAAFRYGTEAALLEASGLLSPTAAVQMLSYLWFSILMTLVFIAELTVGIRFYRALENINSNFTIKEYDSDPIYRKSFYNLQIQLNCCGLDGPMDWVDHKHAIPASCCEEPQPPHADGKPTTCNLSSETLHKSGCKTKIESFIKEKRGILLGVGITVFLIQLLAIIFSSCMAHCIYTENSFYPLLIRNFGRRGYASID